MAFLLTLACAADVTALQAVRLARDPHALATAVVESAAVRLLVKRHVHLSRLAACPARPRMLRPILERTFTHDSEAFLQGLAFHNGVLYEAAGLYKRSSLRIVDPRNGTVMLANHLRASTPRGSVAGGALLRRPASAYFAEGVTHARGKLLMLTWREGSLLEYDADTLRLAHEHVGFADQFTRREGWGIASDAMRLYVSDGSSTIYVVDPHTLLVLERLPVVGSTRARPPA